jgi:hypothetical protein
VKRIDESKFEAKILIPVSFAALIREHAEQNTLPFNMRKSKMAIHKHRNIYKKID